MKRLILIALLPIAIWSACKKDNKQSVPVVTTVAATSITSSSAVVGGTISSTGGTTISKSGICYALNNNPSLTDSLFSGGPLAAGPISATLSNLNANTTYYFRAYAINGLGTGYGPVDSFVTSPGVPTITTAAITNNQALSAQTGGAVSNNGGAAVTVNGVCWSTSANPTVSNSKTAHNTPTNTFSDTLTGLTLGSNIYVRAYATNSFGTGYGNQLTFTVSATGTITDLDGNSYGTITIGTQTWTTSNLRVRHYRNGDPIIDGFTGFNLDTTFSTGAYTFPNGDSTTAASYGLYYTIGAILDSRNIAPTGWHVPTDNDWYTLEFYEGMTASDTSAHSGDLGLRGTIGGKLLGGGSSGLSLQKAGYYCPNCGGYKSFNAFGVYESSTIWSGSGLLLFRGFNISGTGPIYRQYNHYAMPVRLVKD